MKHIDHKDRECVVLTYGALPDLYEGKLQSGGYDEDTGRKNAGETIDLVQEEETVRNFRITKGEETDRNFKGFQGKQ